MGQARAPLSDYALLLLHRLAQDSPSLEVLKQKIACYTENIEREGYVKQNILTFISALGSYSELTEAILEEMDKRGGKEVLDSERDTYDFNEFMSGWDGN